MDDRPEWFSAKRYGFGAGLPVSWQGWAIMLAFLAGAFATAYFFAERPIIVFSILIPATIAFLIVAARTTRGGWHWRWGKRD